MFAYSFWSLAMDKSPDSMMADLACLPCVPYITAEALNEACFCVAVEPEVLRAELGRLVEPRGVSRPLALSHEHLFASHPIYVPHPAIGQIESVLTAIEEVTALSAYRSAAMGWAPDLAKMDPGSPGGLLGFDFHLSADGARLIEINTNPGGVLLNAMLARAQRICVPKHMSSATDMSSIELEVMKVIEVEWQRQRGTLPLKSIAIVDDSPTEQYLYPEFLLFQELFQKHGYHAQICAPDALDYRDGQVWLQGVPVDMVYNRLTDFALEEPGNSKLHAAYVASEVVLSPHPRAHALYADKRNLILLCDSKFLTQAGADSRSVAVLSKAIPSTQLVTLANREFLWTNRRQFFFKPAAGYGSKAAYRGDKLTRGVWAAIAEGKFIAQELVRPSERQLSPDSQPLKVDIRCYAYQGRPLLYTARMYQGRTTNFRTPFGGFAPVLTVA